MASVVFKTRRRLNTALLLVFMSGLIGVALFNNEIGASLEKNFGLGWLFQARGPLEAPSQVVVVAIDRGSSGVLDLPVKPTYWPRRLHAILVDKLVEAGASVIAIDIAFYESREEGDPNTLYHLGLLHEKGLVFPVDKARAYAYYTLAADRGNQDALLARERLAQEIGATPAARHEVYTTSGTVGLVSEDGLVADSISRSRRVLLFQHIEATAGLWLKRDPPAALRKAALGMGPWVLPKGSSRLHQFWSFKVDETTLDRREVPTLPALALQVYALPFLKQLLAGLRFPERSSADVATADFDELPLLMSLLEDVRNDRTESPGISREQLIELMRRLRKQPGLSRRLLNALESGAGARIPESGRGYLRALFELYLGTGRHNLNFYGPPGSLTTIPYHAVLVPDDARHPLDLSNKVVFVGAADFRTTEQKDRFYTYFSDDETGVDLSGVEIAATAFANLLNGATLRNSHWPADTLTMFALGGVVALSCYLLPAKLALAISTVAILGYFGAAFALFANYYVTLPVFIPLAIQTPLTVFFALFFRYIETRRERENLGSEVRQHLPADLAEAIAERGASAPVNRVGYGVCLLADARSFTAISEDVAPQEVQALVSAYFEMLGENVVRFDGTIVNMLADSMCCFWQVDEASPTNRIKACEAAISILRESHRRKNLLTPRLGLHIGNVAFGKVGGAGRFDFSVLGDPVNTGSRIEALNKDLGTTILASEPVISGLSNIPTRCMGSFLLKGKTKPVEVFEILGEDVACERIEQLRREFTTARRMFAQGKWAAAASRFEAILSYFPEDGPSAFYLRLCQLYLVSSPPASAFEVVRIDHA